MSAKRPPTAEDGRIEIRGLLTWAATSRSYWKKEPSCDDVALDAISFIKTAVSGDPNMTALVVARVAEIHRSQR